jgi:IS30 family transposase
MPRSFTQLTMDERHIVSPMRQAKAGLTQIASVLGRHRSTIHGTARVTEACPLEWHIGAAWPGPTL